MPAPIQPPPASGEFSRPKVRPAKGRPARARRCPAQKAQKKMEKPADTLAVQGQPGPALPAYMPAAAAVAPPKPSFAEALLRLDRRLERSAYYSVSAPPSGKHPTH